MQFRNLSVLVLAVALLFCCGTVIAAVEVDSSSPASSAAPVSSEAAPLSSEPESQPQSSEFASQPQSSETVSQPQSSDAESSSAVGGSSSSQSTSSDGSSLTTGSTPASSGNSRPSVGTYTDNSDTGSDLGLASDGSFSYPTGTSSVQTSANEKNINTKLLTKWLFIPIIFAALSVAGLVYVNYTAYQKKQDEMMHSDFDLSSVKRRKSKRKPGRRRL